MSGRFGHFFDRRFAAVLLQQRLADLAELGHRFDHVHRNPNRAGLVGDRPRDRLANPPRGVGRKLVAAAIFVLVDRPHQAGIAFLNQVEEAQAAVAVLLGDRNDQPQVAAGEFPHGQFVGAEPLLDIPHPLPQSSAASPASCSSGPAVLFASWPVRPWRILRSSDAVNLLFDVDHPPADLFQPLQRRLQPLRPQAQFLDQRHHFPAADLQPFGGLSANLSRRGCRRLEIAKSSMVCRRNSSSVAQVIRHAAENLRLLQPFGHRDFDRPVKGQFALDGPSSGCRARLSAHNRFPATAGGNGGG